MTQSTITITGTVPSQYTVNTSSLSPFSNVVVADSNAGQIETVTVSLQAPGQVPAPANGALSNLGDGSYNVTTGVYTIVGTAAEVTAALNNLVFTPTVADQPEHTVFAINVVDSAGATASNRITTVVSAHPTTIATNGVTILASVANAFIVENVFGTAVAFLKLNGSVVTAGQFPAGWTPVGAVQTGDGYEVAFSDGQGHYTVWNVDSNGNYVSSATGVLSTANPTQALELAGVEANFGELGSSSEFLGTAPATASSIGSNGQLAELEVGGNSQNGDAYELGGTGGPLLELNGSVVTKGQFPARWTPVGALQTGNGYEVAFSNGANEYVVWNTDSNGDYTSNATAVLAGNSLELQGVEAAFGDGKFTGGASAPATVTPIVSNTTTTLAELEVGGSQNGDAYELNPLGGTEGPLLELNGSVVTKGQFSAGWTPVGATKTGDGYEVAFGDGKGNFVVWNTDGNGNFTSAATRIMSSTSSAIELAGIEAAFGENFATGVTAAKATTIATGATGTPGATTLAELEVGGNSHKGDAYELNAPGGTGGPLLELNGSAVTKGQFAGGWTPVGAVENSTDTGYEVAFRNTATETPASEFVVWNVGLNGNYTSAATGILSATSYELESLETIFGVDLNGDGTTGPTVTQIADNTVTTLDAVANQFQLNPSGKTTGPFLELNGSPVTTTTFPAGWTPVGAVQTATGYEVAFGDGKGDFVVWNTDANGNFTSAATGVLPGASNELAGVEANFGDGKFTGATVGPAAKQLIADNTATTLNKVGNLFELTSDTSSTGPLLELNGSAVTTTTFAAGWTPVGAVQTGSGYEVAFSIPGKNEYTVWNVDGNGNFTSAATGVLSSTTQAQELEGLEANFGENFAAGLTKATPTPIASSITDNGAGTATLASVGNLFELNPASGGPLLELNGSAVTTTTFAAGWTPVGAVQTATGYEVAFGTPGKNEYTVWNTDSNGNFMSAATGVLPGATSPSTLAGLEAAFGNEDFAGLTPATPSQIGTPIPNGQLALVGDLYELGGVGGPLLEQGGIAVIAGSLGGWTPVGAMQTATGYEVAWNLFSNGQSQDEYTVWNTDRGGNYTSSALGLVSGQNFMLEDRNPVYGENVSGAPSLSTFLATTPSQANTDAQKGSTTINLGNNSAFASNSNGLNAASPTFSGTPFAITLGTGSNAFADIIEYTLTPGSGIETVANFGANDELNINLRGAPNSALLMVNNGASSVSIFSSADPTHGVVLLGEQKADLLTSIQGGAIGQGHALITLA